MSHTALPIALLCIFFSAGPVLADPMTFRSAHNGGNCTGCGWIAAEGEITIDTVDRLRAFERGEGEGGSIYFDSPGGSLIGGLLLGEYLRSRHYTTLIGRTVPDEFGYERTVPGTCASACAFAFLGGTRRVPGEGLLGVHQFYDERMLVDPKAQVFNALDLSSSQLIGALITDYVFRMGVDPRFAAIAARTPPTEVHYLTEAELAELKVTYDPNSFGAWAIEPYREGVVAFSRTLDERSTFTFFCRSDGRPRLLITSDRYTDAALLRDAVGTLMGPADVFGGEAQEANFIVRELPPGAALEIVFDAFSVEGLPTGHDFRVDIPAPHVNWHYFMFSANPEGAQAAMRVALRNCI